jgi:hypothetical protein
MHLIDRHTCTHTKGNGGPHAPMSEARAPCHTSSDQVPHLQHLQQLPASSRIYSAHNGGLAYRSAIVERTRPVSGTERAESRL